MSQITQKIKKIFTTKNPAGLFAFFVFISLAIFLIYALIMLACGNADGFLSLFWDKGQRAFSDYMGSVRDAAQGVKAYTERHIIYPPLANLFFVVFAQFIPAEYLNTPNTDFSNWANYPAAYISCIIFQLIPYALLFAIFFIKLKNRPYGKAAAVAATLCMTMTHLFERGNILSYALVGTALFMMTYNSADKRKRELGLLGLAFAFSLKFFPAVFGWVLIADKRYKDALRCFLYGLFLLVLPCVFFDGFYCFAYLMQNISSFSSDVSEWVRILGDILGISPTFIVAVLHILYFNCCAWYAVSPFTLKNRHFAWFIAAFISPCFPPVYCLYCWNYLLLVFVSYFAEKDALTDWKETFLFIVGGIPFLYIPALPFLTAAFPTILPTNFYFMVFSLVILFFFFVYLSANTVTIWIIKAVKKQPKT